MKKEGVQRPFFFMLLNPFHKKMKEKVKSIPTCANIHAPTNTTASFIPNNIIFLGDYEHQYIH